MLVEKVCGVFGFICCLFSIFFLVNGVIPLALSVVGLFTFTVYLAMTLTIFWVTLCSVRVLIDFSRRSEAICLPVGFDRGLVSAYRFLKPKLHMDAATR